MKVSIIGGWMKNKYRKIQKGIKILEFEYILAEIKIILCGLGEYGRPRWVHIPEITGSNPVPATNL